MAYIFAQNKCVNEYNKTCIGLQIDILENNEIYNYVDDIFYANTTLVKPHSVANTTIILQNYEHDYDEEIN
jgi:hypothetical protein